MSNDATLSHFNTNLTTWLHRLGVLFLLLCPLGLMLGIATTDITMSGVALWFVLYSITIRDFSWCRERWVQCCALLWVWLIISSLFAIQPKVSLSQSLPFFRFFVFAAALQYWLLVDKKIRRYLVIAIAITISIATLDTLLQFFIGIDVLGHSIHKGASWHHFVYPWIGGYHRLSGLSDKAKIGGEIMMLAPPALVYFIMKSRNKSLSYLKRASFLLITFLIIFCVPLTGERTSTILTLFSCGLLFLFIPQTQKTLIVLFISLVIGFMASSAITPGLNQRIIGRTLAPHSEYKGLLITSWHLFKLHPITGIGLRQFNHVCQTHESIIWGIAPHTRCEGITSPQNTYLELMTCAGFIGLFLFLFLLGIWIKTIYKHWALFNKTKLLSNKSEYYVTNNLINPIMLGVLVAFIQRAWPIQVSTSFFFSWGGMSFWMMMGWLLGYIRSCKIDET